MSEPTEYLIVKNLQAALAAMSVAGGYYYNVGTLAVKLDPDVEAEKLITQSSGPRPFVLLDVQPDVLAIAGTKPNRATVTMPLTVYWVNDSDGTDDDAWMRTYFRGLADVERAVASDISRGGLAFDTRVTTRRASQFRGSEVWAALTAQVTVNRVYGQP